MFNLLNFVIYQVVWFVCVFGAANGQGWIGAVAALVAVSGHLALSSRVATELKLIAAAILVGFVTDSALMRGGFISFEAAGPLPGWQPYWMLALWAAFATTLGYSMSWVTRRVGIAALAGAIGGPLAYWAGAKLDAVSILSPSTALPAIGIAWAAALTILAVAARRARPLVDDIEGPAPTTEIPAFARVKRRSHHAIFLCAMCAVLWASVAQGAAREWNFDVFLDGKRIGDHRFSLLEDGDRRELTSEAAFDVRIFFINAYRYRHEAKETWQGECIERVEARTDDNGKALTVDAKRAGEALIIATSGESASPVNDVCVQTFAYWNPRILEADRLLNPQTGEYQAVRVESMGRERIGGLEADRYRLVGTDAGTAPLQIDLWYSTTLDWLALESQTPDGRTLRYTRR